MINMLRALTEKVGNMQEYTGNNKQTDVNSKEE